MKQLIYDWEQMISTVCSKDFTQEVNNIFESYNTLQTERVAIIKLARQERPTIFRDIDPGRRRKIQHMGGLI